MDVGVRELKAKLSEYLSRVAEGHEVVVTDRGRPVARLVAVHGDAALDRGIEEGWIDPPRRRTLGHAHPLRSDRSILDALDEDRG